MNLLIFIATASLLLVLWELKSVDEVFSIISNNNHMRYTFNSNYLSSIILPDEMNTKYEIKDLVVQKNEIIDITLDSNPTTGYSWNFSIDENHIKLVSKDFLSSSKKLGASGTEKFIFKALKEGETSIPMSYKRPWENSYLYQIIYKIQIKP